MDVVPKFVFQHFLHDPESVSLLMAQEVFDVFQQEGAWTMVGDNAGDVKEHKPLSCACESQLAASNRKRLAREPGKKDIVLRYVLRVNSPDVSSHYVPVPIVIICLVGLLRIKVPFACKHAFPPDCIKPLPQSPYTSKNVDKAE